MASSKKIVVTSEIFIDNNDNNKEIIYSCEIEADKIQRIEESSKSAEIKRRRCNI